LIPRVFPDWAVIHERTLFDDGEALALFIICGTEPDPLRSNIRRSDIRAPIEQPSLDQRSLSGGVARESPPVATLTYSAPRLVAYSTGSRREALARRLLRGDEDARNENGRAWGRGD
jgi:hypothetical protein